jgi:hypothetical protein
LASKYGLLGLHPLCSLDTGIALFQRMRFDPLKGSIIKITNLRLSYPRADSHPFLLTPFTPSPNDGKTGTQ